MPGAAIKSISGQLIKSPKLYEEDFELYNRVKHGNHFYC